MALQKVGKKAITVQKSIPNITVKPAPKKEILDEDKYVEDLEKIIVRDFYPDLPKLKVQKEYLDALEQNDRGKLREIYVKYGAKKGVTPGKTPNIYATPATFETPQPGPSAKATPHSGSLQGNKDALSSSGINRPWTGESGIDDSGGGTSTGARQAPADPRDEPKEAASFGADSKEGPTHNPEPTKKKEASEMSLDKYLAKHTSEDNASFGEIMEEAEKKHRIKHAWLYEQQQEKGDDYEAHLALPSVEQQAIESGNATRLQTWKYTPKNAVMYVPEGVEHSSKEMIEARGKVSREIEHNNTRFVEAPFNQKKNAQSINEAASTKAALLQGKVGVDGKDILPTNTPKVNGYGFVATPSPAPGVEESPLMTWGEIEGTPFRLDGGDTPIRGASGSQSVQAPQFKIPKMPNRDRLGLKLAEKASKAHRAKKQQAINAVKSNLASPSPKFGMASKTDRLGYLSPAAQRLASSKLGISRTGSDKALRASYTPSPSHNNRLRSSAGLLNSPLANLKTPTPGSSRRGSSSFQGTPNSGTVAKSPNVLHSPAANRNKRDSSLTDNLLNLPKRQRAQDFF